MRINSYMNSLYIGRELPAIDELLSKAKASLSFWGTRIVTVDGYQGSISINELARKVMAASYRRCDANDLSLQERVRGLEIDGQLSKFYMDTDTQIKKTNWLRRLIIRIREYSPLPYTTRWYIEECCVRNNFLEYSRDKFIQEFGSNEDVLKDYRFPNGTLPQRITAKESLIHATFNNKL